MCTVSVNSDNVEYDHILRSVSNNDNNAADVYIKRFWVVFQLFKLAPVLIKGADGTVSLCPLQDGVPIVPASTVAAVEMGSRGGGGSGNSESTPTRAAFAGPPAPRSSHPCFYSIIISRIPYLS